jgi:glycosyltransferase involved in cell wall biosynthesis
MVDHLHPYFNFKIITSDRDLGDDKPYEDIAHNQWNKVKNAYVYYLNPDQLNMGSLKTIINSIDYDIVYLNSFFDPIFTVKPLILRKLGLLPKRTVVLAPRGEFSEGALNLKRNKKRLYLQFCKIVGLYKEIRWQASSEYEKKDIANTLNVDGKSILIAPDLPPAIQNLPEHTKGKVPGKLDIVFLSRIDRKKNLDGALHILNSLETEGDITFDIYGPISDNLYWEECKTLIDTLPSNIKAQYKGTVPHEKVKDIFCQYDLFFFPTHGENFGHVILESLSAGCPVLISDQTPWRDLGGKNSGWDIPLNETFHFAQILKHLLDINDKSFNKLQSNSQEFAKTKITDKDSINSNIRLFLDIER